MALPPGVNDRDFSNALREFEKAVGTEWVFTSDADVALYRDAYSPFKGEEEERVASAAVAPHTVEEVQAVVRAANTYRFRSTRFPRARTSATAARPRIYRAASCST